MAGLRVGQAYGVFHRPGFGLLVSVPRSLSTQPPFATQAIKVVCLAAWPLNESEAGVYLILMETSLLSLC